MVGGEEDYQGQDADEGGCCQRPGSPEGTPALADHLEAAEAAVLVEGARDPVTANALPQVQRALGTGVDRQDGARDQCRGVAPGAESRRSQGDGREFHDGRRQS